jgi:hypothetical protein
MINTLDFFAGLAMQEEMRSDYRFTEREGCASGDNRERAKTAYEMAFAMVAERERLRSIGRIT